MSANSWEQQYTYKDTSILDRLAKWLDVKLFGEESQYRLTSEKVMFTALLTNILGLHRVYAGQKVAAVIYWIMLIIGFGSFFPFAIIWLLVDLVLIFKGKYGRLGRTNEPRAFDTSTFKSIVTNYGTTLVNRIIALVLSLCLLAITFSSFNSIQKNKNNASAIPADTVSQADTPAVVTTASDTAVSDTSIQSSTDHDELPAPETEATTETTTTKEDLLTLFNNELLMPDVHVGPVMNGYENKRIGDYGYISFPKESTQYITEENYIEFLEKRVSGGGYNWFTIDFQDGTGIVFGGCDICFGTYGTIDKYRRIDKQYGEIIYLNNTITYESERSEKKPFYWLES